MSTITINVYRVYGHFNPCINKHPLGGFGYGADIQSPVRFLCSDHNNSRVELEGKTVSPHALFHSCGIEPMLLSMLGAGALKSVTLPLNTSMGMIEVTIEISSLDSEAVQYFTEKQNIPPQTLGLVESGPAVEEDKTYTFDELVELPTVWTLPGQPEVNWVGKPDDFAGRAFIHVPQGMRDYGVKEPFTVECLSKLSHVQYSGSGCEIKSVELDETIFKAKLVSSTGKCFTIEEAA